MARARSFGLRPAARSWQRLAMLALCAMLLAAQHAVRAHGLAHQGDEHAAALIALGAGHDDEPGYEAGSCALCLAGAAVAHLMPAAHGAAPGPATPWFVVVAAAIGHERRPTAATRFIRGPPQFG